MFNNIIYILFEIDVLNFKINVEAPSKQKKMLFILATTIKRFIFMQTRSQLPLEFIISFNRSSLQCDNDIKSFQLSIVVNQSFVFSKSLTFFFF